MFITLNVALGARSYPIYIGDGLLSRRELVEPHLRRRDVLVVTNETVGPIYLEPVRALLAGSRVATIALPDGEQYKTMATVNRVLDALVEARFGRDCVVLALGGGVVGDIAGFAASIYQRGVDFIQVPTTLLAQVDSAVGGKTGVNLPAGKNLVGAFHAPSLVVCDPAVLRTLPRREFRAGLNEAIKYGVIASRPLFDRIARDLDALFARQAAPLAEMIAACCRIKADVVMADEHEHGQRRILNFGHTAGHALESITRYRRYRHGEAVGLGMLAAAELAVARGALHADDRDALRDLITRMGPMPATTDLRVEDALTAMGRDKKVAAGRLHYVLPVGIGETLIVDDVTREELGRALQAIGLQ